MQGETFSQTTATLVAMAEIAEAINDDLPLDKILYRILGNLVGIIPGDALSIALMDPSQQTLQIRAAVNRQKQQIQDRVGIVMPITELPTAQIIIDTRTILYIPDTSTSPLWRPAFSSPDRGFYSPNIRAFIGLPLLLEARVEGMLFVDFDELTSLTEDVRYTLLAFARYASAAIHNTQQREKTLRSEERYRLVSELTSDAIYEWEVGNSTILWSGDIDSLLQYEVGKFSHTMAMWMDSIHPNDRQRVFTAREATIREGAGFEEEYKIRRANGTYCHVLDRARRFDTTTTQGILGAITDLTNTYELTDALVESEVRYRTLFARSLDAIFVSDANGTLLDFNPAAELLTGYDYIKLVSFSLRDLFAPHSLKDYESAFHELALKGEVSNMEVQFIKPEGSLVNIEMWGSALGDGMYQFVARDISARRQTEMLAAQRVAELTALSDVTRATTAASDVIDMLRGVLPGAMSALEMYLGCIYLTASTNPQELSLVAHNGFTIETPPAHLPLRVCERGRITLSSSLVRVSDTDTYFPFAESSLQVPLFSNGKVTGLVIFLNKSLRTFHSTDIYLMDIIGRQLSIGIENVRLLDNLEQIVQERTVALFRTETRYKSLIEQVPGVVYTADTVHNGIGFISSGTETLFGLDPSEFIRTDDVLLNRVKSEDRAWVSERANRALSTGEDFDAQYRIMLATTNKERWVHHHARQIIAGTGETFWLGLITDVTKLKELDDLKNQFVATVSHELRTPLSAIKLRAATLSNYYLRLSDDQRIEMIQRISYQADILAELIEDVLRLARLEGGNVDRQIESVDLNVIGEDVVEELRPAAEQSQLIFNTKWAKHTCVVKADVTDIARIWRNLISNALKYTSTGGCVNVYTGYVKLDKQQHFTTSSLPDDLAVLPGEISAGDWMVGIIEDNGKGISEYDQSHIFARFYRGEAALTNIPGTGLGLSLVKELLEDYGGYVALSSALGHGSTFTFWIPAAKNSEGKK